MNEWPFKKTLFFLIGSTCMTATLFAVGFGLYKNWREKRLHQEQYRIQTIVQTGPEKEALKTSYLAEILGLSLDQPMQLYGLNLKWAEQKLLESPLIETVKVKRKPPSTLYIEYATRKPRAWLADYKNVAIDREARIFPVAPFFAPKEVPEIYLGLPPFGTDADSEGRKGGNWQAPLKNRYVKLAFEILDFLETAFPKEEIRIKRIDVSNAFAPSLGQREIVVLTEEELEIASESREVFFTFPKILRLAPREYPQQLVNFLALRKTMIEDYRKQLAKAEQGGRFQPRIIDLRIPQLAYIQNQ